MGELYETVRDTAEGRKRGLLRIKRTGESDIHADIDKTRARREAEAKGKMLTTLEEAQEMAALPSTTAAGPGGDMHDEMLVALVAKDYADKDVQD